MRVFRPLLLLIMRECISHTCTAHRQSDSQPLDQSRNELVSELTPQLLDATISLNSFTTETYLRISKLQQLSTLLKETNAATRRQLGHLTNTLFNANYNLETNYSHLIKFTNKLRKRQRRNAIGQIDMSELHGMQKTDTPTNSLNSLVLSNNYERAETPRTIPFLSSLIKKRPLLGMLPFIGGGMRRLPFVVPVMFNLGVITTLLLVLTVFQGFSFLAVLFFMSKKPSAGVGVPYGGHHQQSLALPPPRPRPIHIHLHNKPATPYLPATPHQPRVRYHERPGLVKGSPIEYYEDYREHRVDYNVGGSSYLDYT